MQKIQNARRAEKSEIKITWDDYARLSVVSLFLSNLFPVYAIIVWKWPVFPLMLLFWIENLIIGVVNLMKIAVCSPGDLKSWAAKLFIMPFFTFHYGMFCFVHGVFLMGFFGGMFTKGASFPRPDNVIQAVNDYNMAAPIFALAANRAFSFLYNFIFMGEYKSAAIGELMGAPYGRVVILHVTLIASGFFVMALGSPMFALATLTALKIWLDARSHVKERKGFEQKSLREEPEN